MTMDRAATDGVGAAHCGYGMSVESPCTGECTINLVDGYCMGCLRTIKEIMVWSEADDETKQEILDALAVRRAEKAERDAAGDRSSRQ